MDKVARAALEAGELPRGRVIVMQSQEDEDFVTEALINIARRDPYIFIGREIWNKISYKKPNNKPPEFSIKAHHITLYFSKSQKNIAFYEKPDETARYIALTSNDSRFFEKKVTTFSIMFL